MCIALSALLALAPSLHLISVAVFGHSSVVFCSPRLFSLASQDSSVVWHTFRCSRFSLWSLDLGLQGMCCQLQAPSHRRYTSSPSCSSSAPLSPATPLLLSLLLLSSHEQSSVELEHTPCRPKFQGQRENREHQKAFWYRVTEGPPSLTSTILPQHSPCTLAAHTHTNRAHAETSTVHKQTLHLI